MSTDYIPALKIRGKYFTHQDLVDATEHFLRHRIKNLREKNQILMGRLTAAGHHFSEEEWREAYREEIERDEPCKEGEENATRDSCIAKRE